MPAPAPDLRGCFVTATDTGVGKTIVAAAIAAALRARGVRVAASKPVVTGLDEPDPGGAPPDHVLLAACTGQSPDAVTAVTFGPAVSPHLAAALAGTALDPQALLAHARAAATGADVLVGEGVGGLLVPLTPDWSVRDHAAALGLPLVLVARPGLGTINHTLLSVAAARAAGLEVRAIVMNPWPDAPSAMEADNRATIGALTGVPVWTLAPVDPITPDALAAAASAAGWPLDAWVA